MSKKYGFTTGVIRVDGWIEPDGTFFPCASWKHDCAANMIARHIYGDGIRNGTKELESRGWVRCTPPYLHYTRYVTEAQLATAREVMLLNGNEFTNAKMLSLIGRLEAGLVSC